MEQIWDSILTEGGLGEVRRRLDHMWHVIETSDLDLADATDRIKAH